MMMPLLGQLTRLRWRVVSAVIVSPHCGCGEAAGALRRAPETIDLDVEALLKATTLAALKARITASETNVAGAAWKRSLAGILSSLCLGRAGGCAFPGEPTPVRHRVQGSTD